MLLDQELVKDLILNKQSICQKAKGEKHITVNYKIISSGSSGSAVVYEDIIMVDVGISFNKLKGQIDNVKYLLCTHSHKDHIYPSTVAKVQESNPNIVFICGEWLKEYLIQLGAKRVYVLEFNKWYRFGELTVSLVAAYHDILNCGYRIHINGKRILHITDTYTLDGIVAKDYDGYFIEANYDEIQIEKDILDKQEKGLFSYEIGAKNSHLSFQKSVAFFKKNRKESSIYVPLHISHKYKNQQLNVLSIINEKENQYER